MIPTQCFRVALSGRKMLCTSFVFVLLFAFFGLLGGCGQQELRYYEAPFISIRFYNNDLPMETKITNITRVVEDALAEIKGVVKIESYVGNYESSVRLYFDKKHDVDATLEDVRKQVAQITELLPETAKTPKIGGRKFVDGQFVFLGKKTP